jgi:hypothetical protein
MRARRYCLILVSTLLIPAPAHAHLHKAAMYAAGTFDQGSNLGGFELAGDVTVHKFPGPDRSKFNPQCSLFLDVGANWGSHGEGDRTQAALMAGGRATWGDWPVEPFVTLAYVLLRTQDSVPNVSDTRSGFDTGAGLSIRIVNDRFYLRGQYDYTFLWGSDRIAHHYKRISIGVEVRIPRCKWGTDCTK